MHRLTPLLALAFFLLAATRGWAVFEAEMPLAQLVKDSHVIALAKVERLDRERGQAVLSVERILSGGEPLQRVPVKLVAPSGGEGNPQDMLARLEDGTILVVFLSHISASEHQFFVYGNGSWFKLRGTGEGDAIRGQFLQGEPYLRKTYHGEVDELVQLIESKGPYPAIDKQAKPGLGPILHGAPQPAKVADTSNEIELGSAWTTEDETKAAPAGGLSSNYVVAALLAVAAVGLVFMITRSTPGAAK